MNKKGFTLAELGMVTVVVAFLLLIGTYSYYYILNKARADKNRYFAEELNQSIKRYQGLNPEGTTFPTVNSINNPTDFAPKDKEFKEALSEELAERITFSTEEAKKDKTKIRFESCNLSPSDSGVPGNPVGVRIYYWNNVDKKYNLIKMGKDVDDNPSIRCISQ